MQTEYLLKYNAALITFTITGISYDVILFLGHFTLNRAKLHFRINLENTQIGAKTHLKWLKIKKIAEILNQNSLKSGN